VFSPHFLRDRLSSHGELNMLALPVILILLCGLCASVVRGNEVGAGLAFQGSHPWLRSGAALGLGVVLGARGYHGLAPEATATRPCRGSYSQTESTPVGGICGSTPADASLSAGLEPCPTSADTGSAATGMSGAKPGRYDSRRDAGRYRARRSRFGLGRPARSPDAIHERLSPVKRNVPPRRALFAASFPARRANPLRTARPARSMRRGKKQEPSSSVRSSVHRCRTGSRNRSSYPFVRA